MKTNLINTQKYIVRDRESGNVIEECETIEEARDIVKSYEQEDMEDGSFTPDFYEITHG